MPTVYPVLAAVPMPVEIKLHHGLATIQNAPGTVHTPFSEAKMSFLAIGLIEGQ
jgi:hypothetical protein